MLIRLNRIETYKYNAKAFVLALVMLVGGASLEAAQHAHKIAAGLGAAAYWGLTLAQPATIIKDLYEKKTLEETYDRYDLAKSLVPRAIAFAEQELVELGLPKARAIPCLASSAALYNDICVYAPLFDRVEESLQRIALAQANQEEPAASDLASVMILKGVIHHEVQHIKNGDINWRFLVASIASAAVPVGVRAAWRVMRPIASQAKKLPNMRKAMSGSVNLIVSGQIFATAMRKIEQQADDEIKDPVAIKGNCYSLQEYDEMFRVQKEYSPLQVWLIDHNLTDHPSPVTRIARFNERLQED